MIKWKKDKALGYVYSTGVDHPNASSNGKIYEHVYVMSSFIGRALRKDECVHHIDRDRANNSLSNLKLMTIKEHAILHALEDRNAFSVSSVCKACGNSFEHPKSTLGKYCSYDCSYRGSRKFEVTREELHKLVWSIPTLKVADLLGVSDVAIAKRCKKLSITKPPRGYWRKVEAGLLKSAVPPLD